MIFKFNVEKASGTFIKAYLAEIKGAHEKYYFKRRFLQKTRRNYNGRRYFSVELGGHGVFELSVKEIDMRTGKVRRAEKTWFVYYRKKYYYINRDEVLFAKANLDLQYEKTSRMKGLNGLDKSQCCLTETEQ